MSLWDSLVQRRGCAILHAGKGLYASVLWSFPAILGALIRAAGDDQRKLGNVAHLKELEKFVLGLRGFV